jgi:hypothetical protein
VLLLHYLMDIIWFWEWTPVTSLSSISRLIFSIGTPGILLEVGNATLNIIYIYTSSFREIGCQTTNWMELAQDRDHIEYHSRVVRVLEVLRSNLSPGNGYTGWRIFVSFFSLSPRIVPQITPLPFSFESLFGSLFIIILTFYSVKAEE